INHHLSYTRRVSNAETLLRQVLEYVQEHYASHIIVADLAATCCCSESYINHLFTKHFGVSVSTYINKIRIEHAKYALLITTDKISTIATDVGFSEPSYFSKVFGNLLGISPSEFRRRYST
ncbi:MAG: helix-turn-helix transcriptional regulator, partial [Firmicutes bacterium]|nr:helix-turn-helix transcriptional regulator [Bacillota bacterium]